MECGAERIRLLAESEHLVALVNQWNIGAPVAMRSRQEQLHAWWPALARLLDGATERIREQ